MSNNNYQCQLDVPASIDRPLFAIPRNRPINWFVSALGTSRVRLWLIMITIAALCAVPMLGQGATSSPDAFEGSPYNDDASTTTLNILPSNISQDHTVHADDDVDWGISIQTEPETEGAFPYSLKFTNLVIPSGSFLVVELYEDGPSSPPSKAAYVSSAEQSRSVAWLGVGIEQIYYSVSAFGSVSPAMSYTVTFTEPTGANNGLASAIGAYAMRVEWETLGVDPSAQGFNVLQSTTGEESSFIPVNTGLVPIPVTPGPCPGSGCVEYEDSGLNPTTIYFYQIEIIESDSSPATWLGTFYGYTEPLPPSSVQPWELYD